MSHIILKMPKNFFQGAPENVPEGHAVTILVRKYRVSLPLASRA